MGEQEFVERGPITPWQVQVALDDVPETGQHFDLVANADARAGVARMAGLRDLPRLQASFDVTRRAGGLHVAGRVSATVGQTCVVTLEPLANEVEETIDLLFAPRPASERSLNGVGPIDPNADESWDVPEPLIGGVVDLGALATEFLILGLDPYPRKPGAIFRPPPGAPSDDGPFAALARLKKG